MIRNREIIAEAVSKEKFRSIWVPDIKDNHLAQGVALKNTDDEYENYIDIVSLAKDYSSQSEYMKSSKKDKKVNKNLLYELLKFDDVKTEDYQLYHILLLTEYLMCYDWEYINFFI